jgi:hypothetical protein
MSEYVTTLPGPHAAGPGEMLAATAERKLKAMSSVNRVIYATI